MVKRKTSWLARGRVIDIEEYHDGRYGAPGEKREKKAELTSEQVQKVNAMNKQKLCRKRLLEYIRPGDCFATLTYRTDCRPPNMAEALKDFQKAMRSIRKEYQKKGRELYWFRNIEQGTKGAWHIHLVINEIGETASILEKAWTKGAVWFTQIRHSSFYDEDFTKLSAYITKDEHTLSEKKDGTKGKPRLRQSSYSTSRNMPLPEAKVDKLHRWKKDPKPKKGYYIFRMAEGINPVTGYLYRSYTMIRLQDDAEEAAGENRRRKKRRTKTPGRKKAKGRKEAPQK